MKVLSLEEIEEWAAVNQYGSMPQLIHTAREYHRMREALIEIASGPHSHLCEDMRPYRPGYECHVEVARGAIEPQDARDSLLVSREALKESVDGTACSAGGDGMTESMILDSLIRFLNGRKEELTPFECQRLASSVVAQRLNAHAREALKGEGE